MLTNRISIVRSRERRYVFFFLLLLKVISYHSDITKQNEILVGTASESKMPFSFILIVTNYIILLNLGHFCKTNRLNIRRRTRTDYYYYFQTFYRKENVSYHISAYILFSLLTTDTFPDTYLQKLLIAHVFDVSVSVTVQILYYEKSIRGPAALPSRAVGRSKNSGRASSIVIYARA